ncbi:MAG TPA: S9 family peptidase [Thermomicrobiales bacterium]|nr:S9 family peptidase [Thermomicrobiales bacterium]
MTAETAGATKRPITIEDPTALKFIADPQISPDGARVAYVVTTMDVDEDTYRSQIWVVPTAGGEPARYTGGKNDSSPRWSPDGARLAFVSKRGDGTKEGEKKAKPQIWLLDLDGGEARQLTKAKNGASDPAWSPDGARLAFLARVGGKDDAEEAEGDEAKDGEKAKKKSDVKVITKIRYKANGIHHLLVDEGYKHLFVLDVAAAADGPADARQITDGEWDDATPAWSPDGATIAFCSNRTPDRDLNNHTDLWVVPAEGGEPRKLTESRGPSGTPAFSPDGRTIAYLGHVNPEPYRRYANANLWVVPADGGAPPRNVTGDFDRSLSGGVGSDTRAGGLAQSPRWTPDGRGVYTLLAERGMAHIYRTDVVSGDVTRIVDGERGVMNFTLSADGRTIAFTATDMLNPGDLYVCDADGGGERRLTRLNAALFDRLDLSAPEHIVYAGVDGWEIDGWLMKPVGFEAGKKYPLILEIHGGPASQYGYSFFHEFQGLAAAGYGVLFTNPRGSTGKTAGFTTANRSRWGEEDYGDIMAGVDEALKRDWVDADRLGVAGGSFGGFMTNWVVGHTDRFKAAVTMRCVSNLVSFFGTSDIGFTFLDMQFETEPWDDVEKLLKYSPITYVKNITTPLLILHSEEDYRCPIEQGEQMFIALKKLGRDVEFVRFPDENHDLSRNGKPAHRIERLQHIVRWFDKYLQD